MENLKVKANNESERNEIQELFIVLGYNFVNNIACEKGYIVASQSSSGVNFDYWADVKEITMQELRDMVVLKRNEPDDANFENKVTGIKYFVSSAGDIYFWCGDWQKCHASFRIEKLNPIKEDVMKEFLNPEQGYSLVKCHVGKTPIPESWIEVPEGAEIFLLDKSFCEDTLYFVKHDGEVFHEYYTNATDVSNNAWIKGTIKELHKGMGKVLWQRNPTTPNALIQDKLKFIEKWLNGEKIQYILGVESEKAQVDESKWHNFTEGAMQYIKRPDIKFREAPKYVTINGIEFKSVKSLLKHVKNNFDLEDGE